MPPLTKHKTLYEGSAVFLREPEQMAEPGHAFRENPHKQVSLDLIHEAEWAGRDGLLEAAKPPAGRAALREALGARTSDLCERIRAGEADAGPFRDAIISQVRRTIRDKLLVSNPGWLDE